MKTVEIVIKSIFENVDELINAIKVGKNVHYHYDSSWGMAYSVDTKLKINDRGDVIGTRRRSEWRSEDEEFVVFNISDPNLKEDKHFQEGRLQNNFYMYEIRS